MKKITSFLLSMLVFLVSCTSPTQKHEPVESAPASKNLEGYTVTASRPLGSLWVGTAMKMDAYNNATIQFFADSDPGVGSVRSMVLLPTPYGAEHMIEQ